MWLIYIVYHLWELRRVSNPQNVSKSVKCHGQQPSGLLQLSVLPDIKRQILIDFKEFKNFYVALCANFSNMTPFPNRLHWLPIQYGVLFKCNLITYKARNFSQPPYLSSLMKYSDLTWGNHLSVSSTRPNKTHGDTYFCSCCSHRMEQTLSAHQIVLRIV